MKCVECEWYQYDDGDDSGFGHCVLGGYDDYPTSDDECETLEEAKASEG